MIIGKFSHTEYGILSSVSRKPDFLTKYNIKEKKVINCLQVKKKALPLQPLNNFKREL